MTYRTLAIYKCCCKVSKFHTEFLKHYILNSSTQIIIGELYIAINSLAAEMATNSNRYEENY